MKRYLLLPILAALLVLSVNQATAQNKPVIGVSGYIDGTTACVGMTYIKSVREAGGVPFVIPVTTDMSQIEDILNSIDGLVMSGGEDFDPQLYGEQPLRQLGEVVPDRDKFDISLIKRAVERGIPLLGICRGEQGLNIALGGTLYQDIPSQVPTNLKHSQKAPRNYGSHAIKIDKNSLVYNLLQVDSISVNSYHHQAVKDVAPGLKVVAVAPDGVVEAIEKPGDKKIVGVQFHPEGFVYSGDMRFLPFFKNLVNEAAKYSKSK
ncbi:MAG: gamma-glutamyl-gamma-aminobutyrate hydrolase family protein [Candidatus Egerieousia sp.]